jgi:hypothetical protein
MNCEAIGSRAIFDPFQKLTAMLITLKIAVDQNTRFHL